MGAKVHNNAYNFVGYFGKAVDGVFKSIGRFANHGNAKAEEQCKNR